MNTNTRIACFVALYIALFVAAMWTISGGVMDIAALVSVPVILCAEVLVLGMIYMTTFHGEAPPEEHAAVQIKAHLRQTTQSRNQLQH